MKTDKINKIRLACIKANPEIANPVVKMSIEELEEISLDVGYFETNPYTKEREVTLADVLLTIMRNSDYTHPNKKELWDIVQLWNLKKPLEGQDEPCLDFIISLIDKK